MTYNGLLARKSLWCYDLQRNLGEGTEIKGSNESSKYKSSTENRVIYNTTVKISG